MTVIYPMKVKIDFIRRIPFWYPIKNNKSIRPAVEISIFPWVPIFFILKKRLWILRIFEKNIFKFNVFFAGNVSDEKMITP